MGVGVKRPAWAAAPAFVMAWSAMEANCQDALSRGHDCDNALLTMRMMQDARVLTVSKEQVEALPRLVQPDEPDEAQRLAEWFEGLRLPFPAMFLDLGGAVLPGLTDCGAAGVLALEDEEGVMCTPFALTAGRVQPIPLSMACYEGSIRTLWMVDPHHSLKGDVVDGLKTAAFWCTERAIAVLGWLESVNVHVVETPLKPKQRKRELAKGRQIALTVQVQQPRRRASAKGEGTRDFSHRFEVRGHYMHFPEGTRLADSDPTKLSFVPGRGFVRKVWCPPHVKGPTDKPLVPKVRQVA